MASLLPSFLENLETIVFSQRPAVKTYLIADCNKKMTGQSTLKGTEDIQVLQLATYHDKPYDYEQTENT